MSSLPRTRRQHQAECLPMIKPCRQIGRRTRTCTMRRMDPRFSQMPKPPTNVPTMLRGCAIGADDGGFHRIGPSRLRSAPRYERDDTQGSQRPPTAARPWQQLISAGGRFGNVASDPRSTRSDRSYAANPVPAPPLTRHGRANPGTGSLSLIHADVQGRRSTLSSRQFPASASR